MNDPSTDHKDIAGIVRELQRRAPLDAAGYLQSQDDATAVAVLSALPNGFARKVLLRLPVARRRAIMPLVHNEAGEQWTLGEEYPEDSVGRLMSRPVGVLDPELTAREAIEKVREWDRQAPITYGYVVDDENRLLGVVVMRDLMLSDPDIPIRSIMLTRPFSFSPDTRIEDAMRETVYRQYPVYPVCNDDGRLIGLVPGYLLFEEYKFSLSTQAGSMVGVDKEEHFTTPWRRCLRLRQPWLHFNLLTAFLAALVVGVFEGTIAQIVVLAVFLPVLAGQSGNTGCQALAVTLRGLTLGEHGVEAMRHLLKKEALLGLFNGLSVGLVAAAAMIGYSLLTDADNAWLLGVVMLLAMTGSCVVSSIAGVLVPLTLKRLGVDPATASSIFLTTATDVASLGMFLGIATLMVL